MELDAIFDTKAPDGPAPQPVETPAPPPVQAEQPTPQPEPEAPPPAPPPPPEMDRMVPLKAMLDTRDELKEAKRRLAELEAAKPPAAAIPDPYDDPAGYQAHVSQLVADQALNLRFELSESMALDKHGDEVVQKAKEWGAEQAARNPGFRSDFLAQKNPIDWVVRQHKRDGLMSEVGEDPDAFVRRRAAELGLIAAPDAGAGAPPTPVLQQAPRPAAPPRSIAAAPGSGTGAHEVATGPLSVMGALFKG